LGADAARLTLDRPDSAAPVFLILEDDVDNLPVARLLFEPASEAALFGLVAFVLDAAEPPREEDALDEEALLEDRPLLACDGEAFFFAEPDFVLDEADPVTLRSALGPASLTASAPSETASPIDFTTLPTSRLAPRADFFTVFTTAPAAPATGSVTRSSVPFRFLD